MMARHDSRCLRWLDTPYQTLRDMGAWVQFALLFFVQSPMIPARGMVSPTFTVVGLPLLVKLVEIISHRYALVILNSTKLTTEISHRIALTITLPAETPQHDHSV